MNELILHERSGPLQRAIYSLHASKPEEVANEPWAKAVAAYLADLASLNKVVGV